jgi:hypothetical protein
MIDGAGSVQECQSAPRDLFRAVAAALGVGVGRGKAARRLLLKYQKRKQDGTAATLRMVSPAEEDQPEFPISIFLLRRIMRQPPCLVKVDLQSEMWLNPLLRPPSVRRSTPICGETGNIKTPF